MISILPSEGLAPSQTAPKQNKLSDNPAKSDEPSFSSFVSRDSADNAADPRAEPTPADQGLAAAPDNSDKTIARGGDAAQIPDTEIAPDLVKAVDAAPPLSDSDATPPADASGEPPRTAVPIAGEAEIVDATGAAERRADIDTRAASRAALEADALATGPSARASSASSLSATEPAQVATPEQDTAQNAKAPAERTSTADAALEASVKSAPGDTDAAPKIPQLQASPESADDVLRVTRSQESVDLNAVEIKTEIRPTQLASSAELAATADKTLVTALARDAAAPTTMTAVPETLVSLGQTQASPAPVAASALTPVAPSVPVAAPSEISAIILNALKNGVEPQEQLIVQLDPPELGRVSIDFKFDAQGVQQITVTSENPEALKRLRELHFELTEALKDHGLSEKNMSFRQQSEDQSHTAWQMPERAGSGSTLTGSEEAPTQTAPLLRSNAAYAQSDRLDLTL